jgi:hypothetical protein
MTLRRSEYNDDLYPHAGNMEWLNDFAEKSLEKTAENESENIDKYKDVSTADMTGFINNFVDEEKEKRRQQSTKTVPSQTQTEAEGLQQIVNEKGFNNK